MEFKIKSGWFNVVTSSLFDTPDKTKSVLIPALCPLYFKKKRIPF
jgi:hypothetical protein